MKKILSILFIFTLFFTKLEAQELSNDELMILDKMTIKTNTTINDINNVYGEYKIKSKSAFGGYAYSYYDEEYNYYLFFETNDSGEIKSYAAFNTYFKTKRFEYLNKYNGSIYRLGGSVTTNRNDEIDGAISYNVTNNELESYWTLFNSNSEYKYDLQKHAVELSKVAAKKDGYEDRITQDSISEDLFYMSEQLKTNGTTLYEEAQALGKEKTISLIHGSYNNVIYEDLPNPISLVSLIRIHYASENFKYLYFDINVTDIDNYKYDIIAMFLDPSFLDERVKVLLNSEEEKKLENVKNTYNEYKTLMDKLNGIEDSTLLFDANYESLPLKEGYYNEDYLELANKFLNMARVGIGIRPLILNKDIVLSAQRKATLVYYINNTLKVSAGHYPTKPSGVTDEFFSSAMDYMNENLYNGSLTTGIINALNDSAGDPVSCGHRYNLLDPWYTEWGLGSVGEGLSIMRQSAHKFSGYLVDDTELVAWPSNGVFTMDLAYNGIGNWTAQFYKNYKFTSSSYVTVENLNTNKTYEINKDNGFLQILGDSLISFRDDKITYEPGDVFKITLHNVINENTKETTDYIYRSVFYSIVNLENVNIEDINLNKTEFTLNVNETDRIIAKITPSNTTNKIMSFTSSNDSVVKVRQDGTITALSPGISYITITSSNITKTVLVKVLDESGNIPYILGDVNFDNTLSMQDVFLSLKMSLKIENATNRQIEVGDINKNNKIDNYDTLWTLRKVLHII